MPVKLTWKSVAGLVATVAGFVLPYVTTAVSHTQGVAAIVGGLVVIGLERLADAKDFATTGGVNVGGLISALRNARSEADTLKSQAAADYESVKAQVLADLSAAVSKPAPPVYRRPPAAPTTEVPSA